jgi:gas vesicle protein
MARGHDRFDTDRGGSGAGFVMGLLTGTVLGAGLGMLFAPRAGSELRSQLTDQAGNVANQASEGLRRATANAGEWADGGRDLYDKAKDAVSRGVDDAQRSVRDAAASVSGSLPVLTTRGADGSSGSGGGSSFGSGSNLGSTGSEGSSTRHASSGSSVSAGGGSHSPSTDSGVDSGSGALSGSRRS